MKQPVKYTIDDIARYAGDAMEMQEKAYFEQALGTEPELRRQLEEYYDIRSTLRMGLERESDEILLKESLSKLNNQYFGQRAKKISLKKFIYRTLSAASATILILYVWSPWSSDLYSQYSGITMPRMAIWEDVPDSLLTGAEQAFNKKDFKTARQYLYQIQQNQPDSSMFAFYYAITLMESDSLLKSRTVLKRIFNSKSAYKDKSAFFIALSYLKEKDSTSAKGWLKKIPHSAGNYKNTRELLKKIK